MSSFSRFLDMASRAVDKASSARPSGSAAGRDWRDVVRSAADAVTGGQRDSRPAPGAPGARSAEGGRYAPPAWGTDAPRNPTARYAPPPAGGRRHDLSAADREAIARYDYLVRTASPEQVEHLHRDAFDRLTPAQRAHVRSRMDADLAPHERPRSDSAADLARAAGRAEAQRPGRMRQLLARAGGTGAVVAGAGGAAALLAVVAGGAVVSAVAAPLLAHAAQAGVDFATLAEGVDLEALATGIDVESLASGVGIDGVADLGGTVQDGISGVGEQISGIGESLGEWRLPGLGDFFGR